MRRSLLTVLFFVLGAASVLFAQKAGFVNLEAKEKRDLVVKLMIATDMGPVDTPPASNAIPIMSLSPIHMRIMANA